MAIITHPLFKQPLEKWINMLIAWVGIMAIRIGLDKVIEAQKPKKHHGAALLLPDFNSSKHQEVLAAAIVWARGKGTARSETPAIFIQKIREWTDYNKSQGKADPRPYRSYQEWCDKQFPAQNFESIQRVIQSLEKLGLLITEQDPDCRDCKRYAVNEEAVHDLVERWAAAHPEIAAHFRGKAPRLDKATQGLDSESPRLDPSALRLGSESTRLDSESQKGGNQPSKPNLWTQLGIKRQPTRGSRGAARRQQQIPENRDFYASRASSGHRANTGIEAEAPQNERTTDPHPSSAAPSPVPGSDQIIGTGGRGMLTPMDVWNTALHQLSLLFDRPSFEMWLKTAQLLRYECIDGVGTYTVGVPTKHAQDMLQHRYYRNVQRVFEGLHNSTLTLKFEILPPSPPLSIQHFDEEDDSVLLQMRANTGEARRGQARQDGQRWQKGQQWQR